MKSSVDEIRERFDRDVERFSNLETGQSATVDAPIALELIAQAAVAATPNLDHLLDVGCGAGNFALRVLEKSQPREVTLIDLSQPMLERASRRIEEAHGIRPDTRQGDLRELALEPGTFDVILAGAVLHHLRADEEWTTTFAKLYRALRPGGSLWIFDLITQATSAIHQLMWRRYGEYLIALKDASYRDHVFDYIEKEDSPRPLLFQVDQLRQAGFLQLEILHVNTCFAAFGAIRDE